MLIRFILFGILGTMAALVFTALKSSLMKHSLDLNGQVSLVLFPAFGFIAILYPLVAIHISKLQWYFRGAILMLIFYVAQYALGLSLRKIGQCPWQYPPGGSLSGLVRITDAPIWFAAGLGVEWAYPYVKAAAVALG